MKSDDAESSFREVSQPCFSDSSLHTFTYARLFFRIATVAVPVCFVAGWIASSERDGMIRRDVDEEARCAVHSIWFHASVPDAHVLHNCELYSIEAPTPHGHWCMHMCVCLCASKHKHTGTPMYLAGISRNSRLKKRAEKR